MLYDLPKIQSRAANAENPSGLPSGGGLARNGRKGSPFLLDIKPGSTVTLLDTDGPGTVRRLFMTFPLERPLFMRELVLRMYWDGQEQPSVEAPVGDFFGVAHARLCPMESELFSVRGGRGFNCRVPMPFRKHALITLTNDSEQTLSMLPYQVDYTLNDRFEGDIGYFHAQFRRVTPPIHTDHVILDGIAGRGRYLGCVYGVRDRLMIPGLWWGEGEVKMYFDGETQPTICGTGAEDYAGFAWGLNEACGLLSGCPLCDEKSGLYSLYRWHTVDPICFERSLKVTIQQIGCGSGEKAKARLGNDFTRYTAIGLTDNDDTCYFDREDDWCSVAYWYQTLPTAPFPPFPGVRERTEYL